MQIIIRKIENEEQKYFAYLKSNLGKASYLLYFSDNIYGAVSLNHFIQMINNYFKPAKLEIILQEKEVKIKSEIIKEILMQNGE